MKKVHEEHKYFHEIGSYKSLVKRLKNKLITLRVDNCTYAEHGTMRTEIDEKWKVAKVTNW